MEKLKKLNHESIDSMNVFKGEMATEKYGDKGKVGNKQNKMKKRLLTLFIVGLLLNSYAQESITNFRLIGKTNGISNGTLIELMDFDNRILISTTTVENNSFIFKTKLSRWPIKVMVSERENSNSKVFWLDNNQMILDASISDFKNATVIGSKTETLNQNLEKTLNATEYHLREKVKKEFIIKHPNSTISARLLMLNAEKWGKVKTKEIYNKLSIENQKSYYGQKINKFLDLNRIIEIGDKFINLKISDQQGNIRQLNELKGKTVLLEFWASWCKPCRAENPNLIKNYKKYREFGFEIYAVSLDESKAQWLKAIEQDKTNWIHVSELKRYDEASMIYGISAIPDNFLINKSGEIVGRNLQGEQLNRKLEEILQ